MTMNSVNDRLADAELDDKYDGLMIGTVVENADPLGISRIKVKIPNLLDPDQGPVPWCLPSKHSPFGQGPNYGVYGTPRVGSPVRVSLQGGDPQHPVYEADEYLASSANPKFKDPNTWGFKDPGGSELFVNYSTGAWEFTHQSGDTLKYDGQGNLSLHVLGDQTTDIDGDDTETIKGDSATTIEGNETITVQHDSTKTVQGAMNLTVSGNAAIHVAGNLDVTAGGTTNVTSTSAVNIKGSTINLN